MMGHVYIFSTPDGYYKIGSTTHPDGRLANLRICLPYKLQKEFLFMCALGSEKKVERLLHQKFAHRRMNGEWFMLTDEDIAWFQQNPLPLPIAVSHSACYDQNCLGTFHDEHLVLQLLGLS